MTSTTDGLRLLEANVEGSRRKMSEASHELQTVQVRHRFLPASCARLLQRCWARHWWWQWQRHLLWQRQRVIGAHLQLVDAPTSLRVRLMQDQMLEELHHGERERLRERRIALRLAECRDSVHEEEVAGETNEVGPPRHKLSEAEAEALAHRIRVPVSRDHLDFPTSPVSQESLTRS